MIVNRDGRMNGWKDVCEKKESCLGGIWRFPLPRQKDEVERSTMEERNKTTEEQWRVVDKHWKPCLCIYAPPRSLAEA